MNRDKLFNNPNRIIDLFDKLYNRITDRNKFLTKVRFYSIQRFSVRVIANLLIPLYLQLTKNGKDAKLLQFDTQSPRIIASLTTFPARIKKVWIVIESILRQTRKPDMIILWLSREYFGSIDAVPKKLRNLQKRGLQIRFVEDDIRSFKKYIYSLSEYPDDYIITLDDDIIYPTFIISKLVEYKNRYPGALVCHRATRMITENKQLQPYTKWVDCEDEVSPCNNIFITTGGGTLIPPYSLYPDVVSVELFKKLTFHNDDIWLNVMAQLKNTSIAKTDYCSAYLPILYFRNSRLSTVNVDLGLNDRQIDQVRSYYRENLGIDPFAKI